MRPETDPDPRPAAMAAVVVLGLAAAMVASPREPFAPTSRAPGCWASAPAELAPFACGEHGALTRVAEP